MLSTKAIVLAVVAAVFASYCKWARVQVLKDPPVIEAMMAMAGQARSQEPVVVWLGRAVFFLIAGALTFNFGHAVVAAVERYRYTPTALPPLQPLSDEDRAGQAVEQTSHLNSLADRQLHQGQQQQTHGSALDHTERRRRALETLQRDLDEKAAAFKEKQKQEAEARAARAAAAAAEKAAKSAHDAAAQDAAAAAQDAQWDRWGAAVTQQHAASAAAAAASSSDGAPPAAAVPLNEEGLAEDRMLREMQDAEYAASLQMDTEKQRQRNQIAQLKAFRQALQEKLPPEAEAAAGDSLAIRVRLPNGTSAVRQFAAPQSFADVLDWVYALPDMPLYLPGSWRLASSFPKRQLQAAQGLWAADGYRPTDSLQEFCTVGSSLGSAHPVGGYACAARDVFSVTVRPLAGESFTVQVSKDSSVYKVKQQVEQQLGVAPDKQRLIFAGQMLKDDLTMQQYKITSQHTLQLAVQVGGSTSDSSSMRGSNTGGAAAATTAVEAAASSSSGDDSGDGVLFVKDVAQLKQDVAHGASQLALYVAEC